MQTAVVAEGGGQRGIYTAGVLDSFLEKDFNPFDIGCGVSAGAQTLLAYFLEQRGYAKKVIIDLTSADDFLVPYRWMTSQNVIDLDSFFDRTVSDPDYRLPYQRLHDFQRQRKLIFVATNKDSLEPAYLEPDESTVVDYLKASSAVPFLYKSGVALEDGIFVDGGVADPLPVKYAYEQGARRIILIRTVHKEDTDSHSFWREHFGSIRKMLVDPPKLLAMFESHEAAEIDALSFIETPPEDLQIVTIQPDSPLRSQIFGSRSEALLSDYQRGIQDGNRVVQELHDWNEPHSS